MSQLPPILKNRWMWPIYGICAIYILVVLFSPHTSAPSETTAIQPEAPAPASDYSTAAFVKAKRFVTEVLVSPSTAKFPFADGYTSVWMPNDEYAVSSYVDSQNGYGATVRTNWNAVVRYKGGEESDTANWELIELHLDGKQVYP